MTDRGRAALALSPCEMRVGPSRMAWEAGRLVVEFDEIASPPLVGRLAGRIVVTPDAVTGVELPLTPDGAHVWRPFAPSARIEVDIDRPGWRWSGHGYFDANFGTRALEADFSAWTWGRYPIADGAVCYYDARRRDGTALEFGARFGGDGGAERVTPPPRAPLPPTFWRLRRETRSTGAARQVQALLDAPFYSRSAVEVEVDGRPSTGVHEALDLDRFRSPLLKPMLAVRVPRRRTWPGGGRALLRGARGGV